MKRILTVGILLAVASSAFCADKQVEALLAKMRDSYSRVKSARVNLSSDITGQNGKPVHTTSVLLYQAPWNMRVDANFGKVHVTQISNGKTNTIVGPTGRPNTSPASLDTIGNALGVLNLETISLWDWRRQLSTDQGANMHDSTFRIKTGESWSGKKWTVLEETAKKQGVVVRYFIDTAGGNTLIWRTVVYRNGVSTPQQDCKITKLELGVKISPSTFKPTTRA